jgi:flagellar hook-associated protein 3 FlgL
MVARIGDFALFQRLQLQIRNAESNMSNLQVQASSGRAAQQYADIAEDSQRVLSMENSFMKVKRYQDNLKVGNDKLNLMESSVSGLQDVATQLKALLTSAMNAGNAQNMDLSTQVAPLLQRVQSLLNQQSDGKYIFNGNMSNTAPVNMAAWGTPMAVPTNFNAPAAYTVPTQPALPATFPPAGGSIGLEYWGYYSGDATNFVVRADDNMNINYGVSASDPSIAKLVYALRVASTINGAPAAEQTDRLQGALDTVSTAVGGLADLRANIGAQGKLLDDTSAKHGNYLDTLEGMIQNIQSVDIPETMSRLSAQQTQLQASYMTISQLSRVSLVQYLQ